jgi:plastocyanin
MISYVETPCFCCCLFHDESIRISDTIKNSLVIYSTNLKDGKEMTYLSWFYHNLAYNPAAITQADIDEFVSHYSAPGGMRDGFNYFRALSASTALVAVLYVGGSIIMTIILLGGVNPLFASSSLQMPGMMGKNMGMQNMMAMMGKNMGMQNMSAMMGQHMMFMQNMMAMMGKNMTAMQNMMAKMAKQMTGIEKMMTLMAKHMGMKNITTIQGRPVSVHRGAGQSETVSIVKDASNRSSTEPYNPSPLSIPVGTTVTWINNDNTGHTVTEGNPSGNTPANGFDSGILAPGKMFTHTFDAAGTIQYYCTLHPTMLGEVIVK